MGDSVGVLSLGELEKPLLLLLAGSIIGVLGWLAKGLIEGIVKRFFDQAEELKEKNESMLTEKMNAMRADNKEVTASNRALHQELVQMKAMVVSLNHQIDLFRAELKTSELNQKKNNEHMVAIFRSFQNQLNKQGDEISSLGRIIIRLPEEK